MIKAKNKKKTEKKRNQNEASQVKARDWSNFPAINPQKHLPAHK
jgi:hypothetical protein